jgi:transcriptional regulator
MYIPPAFAEDRLDRQHALIREHPLGLLISAGDAGILASPLPFILQPDGSTPGILQCHLSRANEHWRVLHDQDVLVVFQGAESYITPSWYETKRETGKVVPTWNYAMVQVRGRARVIEDTAWPKQQIAALTRAHEGRREAPWSVSDAPEPYIDSQARGIVGIEIPIREIRGKWKVSQNRPAADRRGVAEGLSAEGQGPMSELVREYGDLE